MLLHLRVFAAVGCALIVATIGAGQRVYADALSRPFTLRNLGTAAPVTSAQEAIGRAFTLRNLGAPSSPTVAQEAIGRAFTVTPAGAFVITSATFDSSRYTTGDVAHLSVIFKSNWASGPIQVSPVLKPHFAQSIALSSASGTLTPGAESSFTFTWSVPSVTGQTLVDVSVATNAGSTAAFSNVTVVNELSSAAIQEAQQQFQACRTTTAKVCNDSPENLLLGLIPVAGSPIAMHGAVNRGCLGGEYWNQGRHAQSIAMYSAAVVSLLGSAIGSVANAACGPLGVRCLDFGPDVYGPYLLAVLAPGLINTAITCVTSWFDEPVVTGSTPMIRSRRAMETDSLMSWLPDSLQLAFSNAGDTLVDLALCSGPAMLRIEADSTFTMADSVGHVGGVVVRLGSQGIQCAAIKPGVSRLLGLHSNVTSALTFRLLADTTGTCKFVLFHRRETGEVVKLEYAPFLVDSGGSASLAIAQDSTVFALLVDQNGDGLVDWILYPGGAVVSVAGPSVPPGPVRPSVSLLGSAPNPFFGSTTLRFRVAGIPSDASLVIHDIAGRMVASNSLGTMTAGDRAFVWDGRNSAGRKVPAGVYFYQLVYRGGTSASGRLVVLH